MADDPQVTRPRASWTKLFSAFKVALDLKKLLLAAAGIVFTAVGWWLFATLLYTASAPKWEDYKKEENQAEAWARFQRDRVRWNLLHEMAGPAPTDLSQAVRIDAGDVAGSPEVHDALDRIKAGLAEKKSLGQLRTELAGDDAKRAAFDRAFEIYSTKLVNAPIKAVGRLRTWPWTEDRGPNQYLLVEGLLRSDPQGQRTLPWPRGGFIDWLVTEQLPVLIEPLMKFLAPIGYFFNAAADGFRNRLYLMLVILWTVATWGFFGGAICRLAAVQIARNEKISLRESVMFAREKFLSLFSAPIFPLIFVGILTALLIFLAWLIGFTVWFGDIFVAGPLFPVVLVLGLIMAVVAVGLIGWPLMNPTIAVEGSDNFDALSRSYSYVYQAIWHYLWYWTVAVVYGAALILFVGFMGSLVVYMGKWGLSQAPGLVSADPKNDRDPAYLFTYAPTSFEWRDLLIRDNPNVERKLVVTPSGRPRIHYEFTEEYQKSMGVHNYIGAGFVGFWVGLFFLLIVGFGYSYFWTASTIIYFLVRKHVDDTEVDEVFYDEGELEMPPGMAPPTATPAPRAGTVSLNVVEAAPAATPAGDGSPPAPPAM